jgi:hypothetical protein
VVDNVRFSLYAQGCAAGVWVYYMYTLCWSFANTMTRLSHQKYAKSAGLWIRFSTSAAQRLALVWAYRRLGHDALSGMELPAFIDPRTRAYLRVSVAEEYACVLEDRSAELFDAGRWMLGNNAPLEGRQRFAQANTYEVLSRKIRRELAKLKRRRSVVGEQSNGT